MTVLAVEPFDQYGVVGNLLQRWTGSAVNGITLLTGITDGTGLSAKFDSQHATLELPWGSNNATVICSGSFKIGNVGSDTYMPTLIAFSDNGTNQLYLGFDGSYRLAIKRGFWGTTIATSTNALAVGTRYHIEFKATLHGSAGVVEVRVDGSSVGWIPQTTGLNTKSTANAYANGLIFQGNISGSNYTVDDLVVMDTSGAAPLNDFLNDNKLITTFPAGAGSSTQFTPTGEAANYQCVDNVTPNDAIYVNDATTGHRDTYDITNLPNGTVPLHISVMRRHMKSDAGARSMNPVIKLGSTVVVGANQTTGLSWLWSTTYHPLDPNGNAWTLANANAIEVGQDVAA